MWHIYDENDWMLTVKSATSNTVHIVTILFTILSILTIFLSHMITILFHYIVRIFYNIVRILSIFTTLCNNIVIMCGNNIVEIDNIVDIVTISRLYYEQFSLLMNRWTTWSTFQVSLIAIWQLLLELWYKKGPIFLFSSKLVFYVPIIH